MQSERFLDVFGTNAEYVQTLYMQYQNNPTSVPTAWRQFFEGQENGQSGRENRGYRPHQNGGRDGGDGQHASSPPPSTSTPSASPAVGERGGPQASAIANPTLSDYETAEPLRGVAALIVQNMEHSLGLPVATSQRVIPVKVLEENRRLINQHLEMVGGGKASFTHMIAWALVGALKRHPVINSAFGLVDGKPVRIQRHHVNLGVAIDIEKKDGSRSLIVPNIKNAGAMTFAEFLQAYDDLIARARRGATTPADFQGTSLTLTNPGTIGTVASMPRLMVGQGAIIATGAIGYPAEFQATAPQVLSNLGVSKVLTIGNTYDHRIIQGAESGQFLATVEKLLLGEERFYEEMFADLKVPYTAVRWTRDIAPVGFGGIPNMEAVAKQASVMQLIRVYRVRGHLIANLDPLNNQPASHPDLDPATYGLTIWDLDREFITGDLGGLSTATLRQILDILRRTYCAHVGIEYMNIQVPPQRQWLQGRLEQPKPQPPMPAEKRRRILERLTAGEAFEQFLHRRYIGHKRFSLEGAETLMPILDTLFSRATEAGMKEAVMGMAHRGRLNVLANTIGKSPQAIFSEFEGNIDPNTTQGSGDVKYHLGATGTHQNAAGNTLTITLAANPSHLEAVNPVVEGMTRAKQDLLHDTERAQVLPVLIHGDAAFAGQGLVAETLNLSQLNGYRTGGTIHIVINNQIGFTTAPQDARSSPFATDIAKMIQVPIFHVNGDDPEAAVRVAEIALDYRQTFKKDVVIDMICYRRLGHNESDDPSYTQPILYSKIENHPTVREIYAQRLAQEKVISLEESQALKQQLMAQLEAATAGLKDAPKPAAPRNPYEMPLSRYGSDIAQEPPVETGVMRETLVGISQVLASQPQDFTIHPKLQRVIQRRALTGDGSDRIDWALGEALAFGSLLLEGTPVRLSGQDSRRGTFSHRHAVLYNIDSAAPATMSTYIPLNHLAPNQARFQVFDSMLSEAAVLGFEFGYSLADPATLVLWEAQFGDFVNGAQIIIDQFLVASASKWGRENEVVLLLPHGYEGQGPEHSSARPERFLQLCAQDNIQVCYPTTPAQYFHLLRRQMRDAKKRPLVVLTPKSLLRLPAAASPLDELTTGSYREVIPDATITDPASVRRVVLTSGKLFYDLVGAANPAVALTRVEQYYPYPRAAIRAVLSRYPNLREVIWAQEEPRNMGAWGFISPFLREDVESILDGVSLRYVGRPPSASPATGSLTVHQQEQAAIVATAMQDGLTNEPAKL